MRIIFILLFSVVTINNMFSQQQIQKKDSLVYQLEKVTVSATRYPEKIMEIPYAVTIITEKDLRDLRGYGLDEILNKVPGVLAQSRAGNQDVRIVIRGFGARGAGDRSNSGTTRGIRVMLNGFPETEPDGRTSFDNIDLILAENIEVVRSNASALWGNASGGIIDVSSEPIFKESFINAGGMGGSFGFQKYFVKSGIKLGNGKIFGTFTKNSFDGWRNHSGSKRSVFDIGIISNLSQLTKLGVYILGSGDLFHIPGPLTENEYLKNPKQANSVYAARDERRYNRQGRIGVNFEHGLNKNNSLSSMAFANPKYLQRSERGTFRDFTRYHIGGNLIFRNNFQINSFINNRLITGVDEAYQDGAVLFYSLSENNFRGDQLKSNKREGANNFGAFVQNELILNENISVIAGARYDNVTYYSEDFLEPKYGLQKKSFERITPKAGLTYQLSPVHSIYANLGGGIEVPAGNETDPAGTYGQDTVYLLSPLLEPIKSTTFEVGTKEIFYNGDDSFLKYLTYDAAFYYIIVKNDIIPYRGGRFYFTAGKTTRKGLELGLNFMFAGEISLNTNLTYSQNKYDNYIVDSVHYGKPGKFADYSGNKSAGLPDVFFNAGITYEPEFLNGLYANVNINGTGKYFADDANSLELSSYSIINGTVGMKKEIKLSRNFGIRGFISVSNILDEKFVSSAFINPDYLNGEAVYLEPGLPRSINVSIVLSVN